MKFCQECGTRLKIKKVKDDDGNNVTVMLKCDRCGFSAPAVEPITRPEVEHTENQIKVISEEMDVEPLPTLEVECPRCKNNKAFWWMLQTRGGDEPTTQFYRCTKCNHTWREYT
ncbi:MAG: transcription factor S [Nitrososphaerales archaeon]